MQGQMILPITMPRGTAAPSDQWLKQFNEAEKLAEDVSARIAERDSLPQLSRDMQRQTTEIRKKIAILGTRLDWLETDLSELPNKQRITDRELRKRRDMLSNLSSKAKKKGAPFSMSRSSNRDDLIGPSEKGSEIEINQIAELDDHAIINLQRQVIKEQDESINKLEETILSTGHIALAINEELDLHTSLIDDLDQNVEVTSTRLLYVQKRLKALNTYMRKDSSCTFLLLSVIAIVICVALIWALIKY